MFVTDAFYMSDYMHTDRNPMDSKGLMNTMLTDLNMDDNAITGTKDMDGRKIEVTTNFGATLLSGTELTLGPGPVGIPGIFSIAGPLDSSGAGDPGKVLEGGAGSFKIYPFTLEVTDARVNNLGVAQICMGPYEQMDSTCQGAAGMGTGVGDLYMNQLNDYNTNTASGILSSNRIAVSGILRFPMGWGLVAYKILADRWISESPSSSNYLPNIKFDQSDSTVSNSIYSGTWDATYGYNKPGNTESKDDYASITPAGVSEVKDIVWGGTKSLACEVCKIKSGLDCALEKLDRRLIELDNCKLANPNATSCTVITTGTGSGASCSASKVYPASCTAKGVTCS
jgi:hypothetical protein